MVVRSFLFQALEKMKEVFGKNINAFSMDNDSSSDLGSGCLEEEAREDSLLNIVRDEDVGGKRGVEFQGIFPFSYHSEEIEDVHFLIGKYSIKREYKGYFTPKIQPIKPLHPKT